MSVFSLFVASQQTVVWMATTGYNAHSSHLQRTQAFATRLKWCVWFHFTGCCQFQISCTHTHTHTRNWECKQFQKKLKKSMWAFSLELQSSFILIPINQFSEIREKNNNNRVLGVIRSCCTLGNMLTCPRLSTLHLTHFCEETALTLNDPVLCLRMCAHLPVVLASSFFRIRWT